MKRYEDLPEVLMPKEAAEFLRLSPETLRTWRHLGEGPRFLKMGRVVRYHRVDLKAWLGKIGVETCPPK
ncbi:MAG: helix-turn-helix domain-containing protein [Nitrospinota bacterium]